MKMCFKKNERLSAGSDLAVSSCMCGEVNIENSRKKSKLINENLKLCEKKTSNFQRFALSGTMNNEELHIAENYGAIEINNKLDYIIFQLDTL